MSTLQPSFLYKYRNDSSRTEAILTNGKIWLATANQLNDPLECKTGQIPEEWKRKIIHEMENAQMSGFVMSGVLAVKGKQPFYSLSHRAAKRWFQRLKRLKNRKEKYAAIRAFLKDHGSDVSRPAELFDRFDRQLSSVGVFSLSECPDNQLLWAHYASSHTGLAIGFARVPNCKLASQENTIPVTYSDAKPTFECGFTNQVSMFATSGGGVRNEQKIGFSDSTFRAAFGTKPGVWSYEREWRYVEEAGGLFPWPGPITEVVFGLKLPSARRKHYANLVQRHVPNAVEFAEITMSRDNASLLMTPWRFNP